MSGIVISTTLGQPIEYVFFGWVLGVFAGLFLSWFVGRNRTKKEQ